MSKDLEFDESGETWKSEIDIVKDLAFLNDFGNPGDTDPYKVMYSIGRGLKIKTRQKNQQNFVDSRTGDVLSLKDLEFEVNGSFKKSQGRGRLLDNSSSTKFQLQQQLRLARPLGSGDEVIESYCRRNRSCTHSTSTSGSDLDSQNGRVGFKSSSCTSDSDRQGPRILGTRNSVLQSNALISNLLCKTKGNCNAVLTMKMQNLSDTEDDNCSKNNTDDNSSSCDVDPENDEHSVWKRQKNVGAFDKLRSIISEESGNECYKFSQNCTTSTETNSDMESVTSKVPNALYFTESDSDFPPLNPQKKCFN